MNGKWTFGFIFMTFVREANAVLLFSDFNFIRNGDSCEPAGPEPIPAGTCQDPEGTYEGSSGYRIIPGNTCSKSNGAVIKDTHVEKSCRNAQPPEGDITHQVFDFDSEIVQYSYFKDSAVSNQPVGFLVMET